MKTKVLVTGSNGFTGKYLVRELEKAGYDVYGVGAHAVESYKCHRLDLLNAESVSRYIEQIRPDKVFHLAGIAYVATQDGSLIYKTNVEGCYNLLAALEHWNCGSEGVLLASSANVYGSSARDCVSERTETRPISHYGVSKLAMEQMASIFDLPLVIARPFNYTGIGQGEQFLIPKIVSHFRKRESQIFLGNMTVSREFGDVRNVVSIYRKLLEQPVRGETVNICTGIAYSIDQVIAECEVQTGHRLDVISHSSYQRSNEIPILFGDTTKLFNLIGTPKITSLPELIHWMLFNGQD